MSRRDKSRLPLLIRASHETTRSSKAQYAAAFECLVPVLERRVRPPPRPTGTRPLLRRGRLISAGGEANMQQLQRIAIYARVSSEPHSSGQTIASQLEALQARVASDGQRLPAEQCFVDDGYSGATLLRPALERLRDLAAAGGLD